MYINLSSIVSSLLGNVVSHNNDMSVMTTFERPYNRHKQTILIVCQLDAYGLCFSNLNKISYETNNLISKRIIAQ